RQRHPESFPEIFNHMRVAVFMAMMMLRRVFTRWRLGRRLHMLGMLDVCVLMMCVMSMFNHDSI
ncbi:MAG TPA: hypothetical protein PLR53_09335, partial [Bacteroidales bacterium]|nr:hypothetical protein [Bacteroidales bacterium]